MKAALLIIDLQKAYYNGFSKESMDSAVSYINEVIPIFREKNLPIIWIQDIDEDSCVTPNTEGFEFIDNLLKREINEFSVYKKYGNSFNKTALYKILKENDIEDLIITGYCAEYCVLSTYRGANDLDLNPFILQNGIASGNKEHLSFVERITNLVSYKFLEKSLTNL